MSDVHKRLTDLHTDHSFRLRQEAADEIGRLRASLEKIAKEQSAPTAEGAADLFQRIAREALNGA